MQNKDTVLKHRAQQWKRHHQQTVKNGRSEWDSEDEVWIKAKHQKCSAIDQCTTPNIKYQNISTGREKCKKENRDDRVKHTTSAAVVVEDTTTDDDDDAVSLGNDLCSTGNNSVARAPEYMREKENRAQQSRELPDQAARFVEEGRRRSRCRLSGQPALKFTCKWPVGKGCETNVDEMNLKASRLKRRLHWRG